MKRKLLRHVPSPYHDARRIDVDAVGIEDVNIKFLDFIDNVSHYMVGYNKHGHTIWYVAHLHHEMCDD